MEVLDKHDLLDKLNVLLDRYKKALQTFLDEHPDIKVVTDKEGCPTACMPKTLRYAYPDEEVQALMNASEIVSGIIAISQVIDGIFQYEGIEVNVIEMPGTKQKEYMN